MNITNTYEKQIICNKQDHYLLPALTSFTGHFFFPFSLLLFERKKLWLSVFMFYNPIQCTMYIHRHWPMFSKVITSIHIFGIDFMWLKLFKEIVYIVCCMLYVVCLYQCAFMCVVLCNVSMWIVCMFYVFNLCVLCVCELYVCFMCVCELYLWFMYACFICILCCLYMNCTYVLCVLRLICGWCVSVNCTYVLCVFVICTYDLCVSLCVLCDSKYTYF